MPPPEPPQSRSPRPRSFSPACSMRRARWSSGSGPSRIISRNGGVRAISPTRSASSTCGSAARSLIHMHAPDGTVYPMTGTFREVVVPERLVFSAIAEDRDGHALLEGLITVTFEERGREDQAHRAREGCRTSAGRRSDAGPHGDRLGAKPVPARNGGGESLIAKRPLHPPSATERRTSMQQPRIVSHEEWLAARKAHLKNEKALTRMRDLVSAERRALPWVKVEKHYVFDTDRGEEDARRAVRPQQPADHPSFHVAARSRFGLPELLAGGRSRRRRDRASGESRRELRARLARAARQAHSPTRSAWAGPPNGCRPGTATSTTTITCRSPRTSWRTARSTTITQHDRGRLRRAARPERVRTRTRPATCSTPIRATRAATKR